MKGKAKFVFLAVLVVLLMVFIGVLKSDAVITERLKIGDTVTFGELQWQVLDIQGGKALILSDTVIVNKAYHGRKKITWEECTLRSYLNGEFYDSFSAEEKARIAEATIPNNDNPWFNTSGGSATKDMIFLLSLEEVVKYFGDSGQLRNRPDNANYIIDQYNSVRIAVDTNGRASWWWLRSPGLDSIHAAVVEYNGELRVDGGTVDSDFSGGGARPALWLNL